MGAVCTAALRKEEVRDLIWDVAGKEDVQLADSDTRWRLGRRDSSLNLDLKGPDPPMCAGVRT